MGHFMKSRIGALSGKELAIPDVNAPPMPLLANSGIIHNGEKSVDFGEIQANRGYPDVRSYRGKFGLIVPATNTSVEHELWTIICRNRSLDGIGIHTSNVVTPRPKLESEADLQDYAAQFLQGLKQAVDVALLADPEYLLMGMSIEHILHGIDAIREQMHQIETYSERAWATWHDAIASALGKFKAKRIGLLTPFDQFGNENATRMFQDLGFEVVSSVGFSCANALHIAHIPNWAKERAIVELLATPKNNLDAIVQCGTNMSLLDLTERLETLIGIPILGINAVTFWYALRENGFSDVITGAGRLFREF